MSQHFFYISRKKNKGLYKLLVLLNICCTVGIISLTYVFSYKDFMEQKAHVLESFLEVDNVAQMKYISDLSTLHAFLLSIVTVRLAETEGPGERLRAGGRLLERVQRAEGAQGGVR